MKNIFVFIVAVFSVLCSQASFAKNAPLTEKKGWLQDGKPVPDSEYRKSMHGFGAQLLVIDDDSLFENWDKPETPNLSITDTAIRNQPVFVIFLFINPGTDNSSNANVNAEVTIKSPDGKIYGHFKDMEIWQRAYPFPVNTIQLAVGNLGIKIEDDEPLGRYTIEAKIYDKIKDITLNLKNEFTAKEQ